MRIEAPRRPHGPDRSAASTTRNRAARAARARALATEPEGGGDRGEFFGRRSESGGVRLVAGNGLARYGRPGPWDRAGPVTGRRAGPARPMLVGRGCGRPLQEIEGLVGTSVSFFVLSIQYLSCSGSSGRPCAHSLRVARPAVCGLKEGAEASPGHGRGRRCVIGRLREEFQSLILVDINADTVDNRSDDKVRRRERLFSGCIWLVCREKPRLLEKSLRLVEESPIREN